jgi:hypothetical protein
MTQDNEYVQKLIAARDREVAHRRHVAETLAEKHNRGDTENTRDAFIKLQDAIEAIERAGTAPAESKTAIAASQGYFMTPLTGFAAGRPTAAVLVDSEGHIHFARLKTLENLNSFCQPATISNNSYLFPLWLHAGTSARSCSSAASALGHH